MAVIGLYALNYPQITNICAKTSYILHEGKYNQRNFETTNTLMKNSENNYYEYATGLKTGFTAPAGSCIIATAQKDEMKFLVVVLNAPEPENGTSYRDIDCKTLFEYGFKNFETIIKQNEKIVNFFDKFILSGIGISTIFKIGLTVLGIFICFAVIKRNNKNCEKVKKNC